MTDVPAFEERLRRTIVEGYRRLGMRRGWRLLYSPKDVLDDADVAFIGLNPGGHTADAAHGEFSTSQGSAYVLETWEGKSAPGHAPLQCQARLLFRQLGVPPERVLAGNLVPYRSRSWQTLPHRREALAVGRTIWTDILQRAEPGLVIAMGAVVWQALSRMLAVGDVKTYPLGWGKVVARSARFEHGRLIGLPHLSRYRVFGRSRSEQALGALFAAGGC